MASSPAQPQQLLDIEIWQACERAIEQENPSHVFGLFSGGHDSVCALHRIAQHPRFTAAVHLNTGIGIPETREYVYETCKAFGWPLIEMHAEREYEEMVLDGVKTKRGINRGFPGGDASHKTYYHWLKQRQIRRLVREHKQHDGDRIALSTGARREESQRRMSAALAVPVRREGAQLWLNPILAFTSKDKDADMETHGIERNPVVDMLHRSGECLCGALAQADEIREIELFFPDIAQRIHDLEEKVERAGIAACRWANRLPSGVSNDQEAMPLCIACTPVLEEPIRGATHR
jgi:3'-phosphoadenosine 5'-phosphosulfate sulfotransferase (PAPS reductase)/FAD synthetase